MSSPPTPPTETYGDDADFGIAAADEAQASASSSVACASDSPSASEHPVELLRLVTAGSVDDGKSTLIGRLLFDSKQVLVDQLEHIEHASQQMGHDFLDLSLLTDGLRAEREQGITIDVAYRYFATDRRRFIIADTPGHEQYTRNMVTGASTADLAIVLIDARQACCPSPAVTRSSPRCWASRTSWCASTRWTSSTSTRASFDAIVDDFGASPRALKSPTSRSSPSPPCMGDNVVERSAAMPWYQGPPLLYHLEHVHIASDRNLIDVRFPVQWVIRLRGHQVRAGRPDYRAYRRPGRRRRSCARATTSWCCPAASTRAIAGIDTFDGPVSEAFPPMSVALRLQDDIDVSRGSTIVRSHNQPTVSSSFECLICWMSEQPLDSAPALPGQAHHPHGPGRRRWTFATASTSTLCTVTSAPPRWSSTTSRGCAWSSPRRWCSTPTGATASPAA